MNKFYKKGEMMGKYKMVVECMPKNNINWFTDFAEEVEKEIEMTGTRLEHDWNKRRNL